MLTNCYRIIFECKLTVIEWGQNPKYPIDDQGTRLATTIFPES